MELKRISKNKSNEHEAWSFDYIQHSSKSVFARFYNFGAGAERTSDFHVYLMWEDVKKLLDIFADMGGSEALKTRKALALVTAIEDLRALESESTRKPESD